ncbi:hypothetical protein VTP01DRAFT_5063 [Rhizomucor pusillus]|uniref:uncharacterized protein n=1 Tax=Rhizomucor pusillus TaxID=4840 RepID=UPI0037420C17
MPEETTTIQDQAQQSQAPAQSQQQQTPSEPSTTSAQTTPATTTPTNTTTPTPAKPTAAPAPPEPPQVIRQKYEEAKLELQALLSRKKQVDANLINLENAIYLFEGSYLEDTQQNGNIIRGFDGYLASRPDKRKHKYTELDRLFSLSSTTYQKALAQKEDRDDSDLDSTQSSVGSLSIRKDKKRKLKLMGNDSSMRKKKRYGSTGRDTEEELDV